MKSAIWAPLVVLAAAPHVYAQQADSRPDVVVKSTIEDVMAAIRSDPAAKAGDPNAITRIVEQKFLPATDFLRTTQLALGSAWSKATPEQQKILFEQFQRLLVRTYAAQLVLIRDQNTQFKYLPIRPLRAGATDAVVKTLVTTSGDTMNIDYRLYKAPTGWKIYDINMMGAWMIEVYRNQFAQQIARGGIDGLIKFLVAHNKQE
jgi:phospholipid transport system substrate-binding protein